MAKDKKNKEVEKEIEEAVQEVENKVNANNEPFVKEPYYKKEA